jgi:hypothetical protein
LTDNTIAQVIKTMSASQNTSESNSSQFSDWHVRLREILINYFDESDIETLCFDLRVDYQNLAGTGKAKKVIELIKYLARTGRINELIDYCKQLRPNVPWSELQAAAISNPLVVDREPDEVLIHDTPNRQRIKSPPSTGLRPLYGVAIGMAVVVLMGIVGLIAARLAFISPNPMTVSPTNTPTAIPSATYTPLPLPVVPTVTKPSIEAPIDWTQIVRLRLSPQCGSAQLLPPNIDPDKDVTEAANQLGKIIDEWSEKAWLAPSPDREFIVLYANITGLGENKEWVKLENKINIAITTSSELPPQVNLSSRPGCGGGGTIREFPGVALSSKFNTYSTETILSTVDYLSLQPGELEILEIPFKCTSPGTYQLVLNIPFTYMGKSGIIRSSDIPTIICPKAFTYWGFSLDGNFFSSRMYKWNDNGYQLVP